MTKTPSNTEIAEALRWLDARINDTNTGIRTCARVYPQQYRTAAQNLVETAQELGCQVDAAPAERMYTRAEMLAFGARVLDDRHEFEHFACESDPMNWHGLKPCTRGCVAKHVAVLLDAPVRPQTDEPMFYIQNKGNGGDLVLWWRPERRGYTVCIDQAGLYSQKEAEEIVRNRPPEDIMHAQYDIDTIVGRVIFHETLRRVLREKESAR